MGTDETENKINFRPMTDGEPFLVERVQDAHQWPGCLAVQVGGRLYRLPVREGYHQPADVSELDELPWYVPDVMGDEVGERWWRCWGLARAEVAEVERVC